MYALTIHQPWTHAICLGWKDVENRRWATKHRGPIAIHASVNRSNLVAGWEDQEWPTGELGRDCLSFGAVVAVADLMDCVPFASLAKAYHDVGYDWCRPCGPVCWVLGSVRRLARPVACKGGQRLWRLTEADEAAVREQVVMGGVMVTK